MSTKPKLAEPVWPNAGVEAWYRDRLQLIVKAMADDMSDSIRRVWKDSAGMGMDAQPRYGAGVMFRYGTLVLLLHRTDGQGWAWPGGGVEDGESFMGAAQRECGEEMGMCPDGSGLNIIDVQNDYGVGFVTFECKIDRTFHPTLNSEHDAYMWAPPNLALARLPLHPGVRATLMEWNSRWMDDIGVAQDAKKIGAKPPSQSVLLQRAMHKWGTTWTRRITTMSETIARDFAVKNKSATERAMKAKLAKAGFTVKFKPTEVSTSAFDAVIAENVGLIRTIPQKYLSDVQAQVWQSVMAGSDMKTLSEGLHDKYGVAWRRASLIAKDQNHKAKAAMERARRLDNGLTKAKWMHSHAGVTPRPTHVAMDGKVYGIAEGMYDSAVDKWIWPGVEINCRCTDRAVIPGFD